VSRALVIAGATTAILLGVLVVALLTGDKDTSTQAYVLHEYEGSYRGVPLGATRHQAVGVLGSTPRWHTNDSIAPRDDDWADIGAPGTIASSGKPDALRYDHLSVMLDDGRVTAIVTAEDGAETTAGVALGDPLRKARKAYPDLTCGDRPFGDSGTFPYCGGRLTPTRWIWFGRDPIASITIASLEVT
jgi:hypothetical protein